MYEAGLGGEVHILCKMNYSVLYPKETASNNTQEEGKSASTGGHAEVKPQPEELKEGKLCPCKMQL